MNRLALAAAGAAAAASLTVMTTLAAAPAEAYTLLSDPAPDNVDVRLDHDDLVAIYNDPAAAGRICQSILGDVIASSDVNIVFAPVDAATCPGDLQWCTDAAVGLGLDTARITWSQFDRYCRR